MNGKVVNISEDQKQPNYIDNSLITRIISGEPISIQQKGIDNIDFIPYVKLIFTVNDVIDFKETGIHLTDRFWIIPFNATFVDEDNSRDINILDKITTDKALQIIATRAVQAFEKVLLNKRFTIPEVVEKATKQYFFECNNVEEFCSLFPIKLFMFKSRYYEEYCKWCKSNNRKEVSNSQFGKRVLALGYRAERFSFGNNRNTYYTSSTFDNTKSRFIYDSFLSLTGITEAGDIACENNPKNYDCYNFIEYLCKILFNEIEIDYKVYQINELDT